MKYTDRELDRLLEKLIASTRSPRGKFSAAASYQILEKRLPRPALRLFSLRTLSAVAAIALLCFIGWNTYCYLKPAALQTISTLADTRTIKLPDGTEVTLNHFSSLTYPEKFKGEHREVNLKGEAYFEVTKNRKHSFIVQTESVNVEVLGTHFNVESYPDDPEVKTTLLEGSVAVSNKSNSVRIVLKPNESAIYNKEKKSMTLEVSDLHCRRDSLAERRIDFYQSPLAGDCPPVVQHIWRRYLHNRHCFAELPDHGTVLQ